MTNYEKYKDLFIEILTSNQKIPCVETWRVRTKTKQSLCPLIVHNDENICDECKRLSKEWLVAEAPIFDLEEIKAGDKIRMRKHGNTEFSEFEVVCNRFPACWLRLRVSENEESFLVSEYSTSCAKDEDFLIFYDDLEEYYDIEEVFR